MQFDNVNLEREVDLLKQDKLYLKDTSDQEKHNIMCFIDSVAVRLRIDSAEFLGTTGQDGYLSSIVEKLE